MFNSSVFPIKGNDPNGLRYVGAKLYTDLSLVNDSLIMFSYGTDVKKLNELQSINGDDTRQKIKQNLVIPTQAGNTNTAGALTEALKNLPTNQNSCSSIIVLTDGIPTNSQNDLSKVSEQLADAHIPVFFIFLGSDFFISGDEPPIEQNKINKNVCYDLTKIKEDAQPLCNIATRTSGEVFHAATAGRIVEAYAKIFEILHPAYYLNRVEPTKDGSRVFFNVTAEQNVNDLTLVVGLTQAHEGQQVIKSFSDAINHNYLNKDKLPEQVVSSIRDEKSGERNQANLYEIVNLNSAKNLQANFTADIWPDAVVFIIAHSTLQVRAVFPTPDNGLDYLPRYFPKVGKQLIGFQVLDNNVVTSKATPVVNFNGQNISGVTSVGLSDNRNVFWTTINLPANQKSSDITVTIGETTGTPLYLQRTYSYIVDADIAEVTLKINQPSSNALALTDHQTIRFEVEASGEKQPGQGQLQVFLLDDNKPLLLQKPIMLHYDPGKNVYQGESEPLSSQGLYNYNVLYQGLAASSNSSNHYQTSVLSGVVAAKQTLQLISSRQNNLGLINNRERNFDIRLDFALILPDKTDHVQVAQPKITYTSTKDPHPYTLEGAQWKQQQAEGNRATYSLSLVLPNNLEEDHYSLKLDFGENSLVPRPSTTSFEFDKKNPSLLMHSGMPTETSLNFAFQPVWQINPSQLTVLQKAFFDVAHTGVLPFEVVINNNDDANTPPQLSAQPTKLTLNGQNLSDEEAAQLLSFQPVLLESKGDTYRFQLNLTTSGQHSGNYEGQLVFKDATRQIVGDTVAIKGVIESDGEILGRNGWLLFFYCLLVAALITLWVRFIRRNDLNGWLYLGQQGKKIQSKKQAFIVKYPFSWRIQFRKPKKQGTGTLVAEIKPGPEHSMQVLVDKNIQTTIKGNNLSNQSRVVLSDPKRKWALAKNELYELVISDVSNSKITLTRLKPAQRPKPPARGGQSGKIYSPLPEPAEELQRRLDFEIPFPGDNQDQLHSKEARLPLERFENGPDTNQPPPPLLHRPQDEPDISLESRRLPLNF